MRIIFLDIDGVVCTTRSINLGFAHWFGVGINELTDDLFDSDISKRLNERREKKLFVPGFSCELWPFDDVAVNLLHKIVRENDDIRFVISSSWRVGKTPESLAWTFRLKGLHIPIIGFTKTGDKTRGEQIKDWLDEYSEEHQVTQFCVLDDEVQYDIIQTIPNNCVETSFDYGLTEEKFNEVMKILESKNGIHR